MVTTVGVPDKVRVTGSKLRPCGKVGVSVYCKSPLPPEAEGSITVPVASFCVKVRSSIPAPANEGAKSASTVMSNVNWAALLLSSMAV